MYKSSHLIQLSTKLVDHSLLTGDNYHKDKAKEIIKALLPLERELFIDRVIRIALHLDLTTWTGEYSIRFNDQIRKHGISTNLKDWTIDRFSPELFHCELLSVEERNYCMDRLNHDFDKVRNRLTQNVFPQAERSSITFMDSGQLHTVLKQQLIISAADNKNPVTGKPLQEETLNRIRSRYWIELKLVKCKGEKEKKKLHW